MDKKIDYELLTTDQYKAVINKLGGPKEALRFLRGEFSIVEIPKQENIEYDWLISNGMSGEEWIVYFESKNYQLGNYAKSILRSKSFIPTKGKRTKIAILKNISSGFENLDFEEIITYANKFGFSRVELEVTCLARQKISDKQIKAMNLSEVVVVNKKVHDFNGDSRLFCFGPRRNDSLFRACMNYKFTYGSGFLFTA